MDPVKLDPKHFAILLGPIEWEDVEQDDPTVYKYKIGRKPYGFRINADQVIQPDGTIIDWPVDRPQPVC